MDGIGWLFVRVRCRRRIVMVLDVFMVYVKAEGGVDKPYATVCQSQANLPVLPNTLAIEQLQCESKNGFSSSRY